MSIVPFPSLPEMQILKAKLAVSEARLRCMARESKASSDAIHRDFCHHQLAIAILALKEEYNYSWDCFRETLEAPCSTEMLKSVALGRKKPSDTLYNTLCTCLCFTALRNGYTRPNFPSIVVNN